MSSDDSQPLLPESITTTLKPGDNQVGWVAEPLSMQDLFEQLPQVELVYRWDAETTRYEMAAARLPQRYWSLQFLEPGRAYVLRAGGPDTIEWQRSVTPARGLIKLRSGVNWTAWSGPDEWSVVDVGRGIGVSLLSIELGDHTYDPADPESALGWPEVMRGDALKVTVARDVIWLQPTFVTPELLFTGNPAAHVQREIERDLADVLSYSAQEFGAQADAHALLVVVSDSARSAFNLLREQGRESNWEDFRSFWQRAGGWYDAGLNSIQLKANYWTENRQGLYAGGRHVLLHEYYHAVQDHLSDGGSSRAPVWLIEGTATWFEADLRTQDRSGRPLARQLTEIRNRVGTAPSLESTTQSNETWEYQLGLLATDMLIEQVGVDALQDYFRALAPNRVGANGIWQAQLTGAGAFPVAFEKFIDDFYREFEERLAKWRGSGPRRPQPNEVRLRGRLTYGDGAPVTGAWLRAEQVRDGTPAGWDRRAVTNAHGEFELFAQRRADYRILLQLGEHHSCHIWWAGADHEASMSPEQAQIVSVGSSRPESISIVVDDDRCRWQISGRLLGPEAQPLSGFKVSASSQEGSADTTTEADGSFAIDVAKPGSYRLSADLGGCRLYWRGDAPPGKEERAVEIEALDQDVAGVQFQVLKDPCIRISGRLLDANGDGMDNRQVAMNLGSSSFSGWTDREGNFVVTVPEAGRYRMYTIVDGCQVHYRRGAATSRWSERTLIHVAKDDIRNIVFQLPEGLCSLRISGKFLNADGTARTDTWVGVGGEPGNGGAWPADDGAFSFAVPGPGTYDMWVTIDGCEIYYAGNGAVGDKARSRSFNLGNADISGIEFRLPEDPASVCN